MLRPQGQNSSSSGSARLFNASSSRPRTSIGARALTRDTPSSAAPKIKVIGVGGGGCRAVHRLSQRHGSANTRQLQWVVLDTDAAALRYSPLPEQHRLQIGSSVTLGESTGKNWRIGRGAAARSAAEIGAAVQGADVVFVLAGIDGGTGGGAAPLVAAAAKQQGALTIAVATAPVSIPGRQRCTLVISELRAAADGLIVIPSHKLLAAASQPIPSAEAFETADRMTGAGVQAIADLLLTPGDHASNLTNVRQLFDGTGSCWLGHGTAIGPERAVRATLSAMASPLRLANISTAGSILWQLTAPASMAKAELRAAVDVIRSEHHPAARVLFGAVANNDNSGRVCVTVIASSGPSAHMGLSSSVAALDVAA